MSTGENGDNCIDKSVNKDDSSRFGTRGTEEDVDNGRFGIRTEISEEKKND